MCVFVALALSVSAQTKFMGSNGLWGVKNSAGKIMVKPQYKTINFINGEKSVAIARETDKFALIDLTTGKAITAFVYGHIAEQIGNGLIAAHKDGKYGYLDVTGREVIPFEYQVGPRFSGGYASIRRIGGDQWGYIDTEGKWYDSKPQTAGKDHVPVSSTSEKVASNNITTKTTTNGGADATVEERKFAVERKSAAQYDFRQPYLSDTTKFMVLNTDEFYGNTPEVSDVTDGVFCLRAKKGWNVYDVESGKWLFKEIVSGEAPKFSGGAATIKYGQGYAIIYKDGTLKELDSRWSSVSEFADGVATVKSNSADGTQSTFVIDITGAKIWPNLTRNSAKFKSVSQLQIGTLSDGRRKYSSGNGWGYIDEQGKIIIEPLADSYVAENFSEGYALISQGRAYGLIDKKGNVTIPMNTLRKKPSPVTDGYLRSYDVNDDVVYYTPNGKEVKRYSSEERALLSPKGSGFYEGHAFVQYGIVGNEGSVAMVVDADFEPERFIDNETGFYGLSEGGPLFNDGLALVNHNESFINAKGEIHIQAVPSSNSTFRPFCNGYAYAESVLSGIKYRGFIRPNGEYSVIFSFDKADNKGPINPNDPIDPPSPQPIPPPLPPPVEDIPGPPKVITSLQPYALKVVASPAEGGSTTGSGQYRYGTKVTIGATANQGWTFAGFEPSTGASKMPESDSEYMITDNSTIYAKFIKDDTTGPVPTGAWQATYKYSYTNEEGTSVSIECPYYLQLQSEPIVDTPYGNKYGFLTIMLNPDVTYILPSAQGKGAARLNLIYMPMAVEGIMETDGRRWLHLEGGGSKAGNIFLSPPEGKDGIQYGVMNIFLMLFGNGVEMNPGSYRVEFTKNVDGTITLGTMQRFHELDGWIAAGDERFFNLRVHGLAWGADQGLPADYFSGKVLSPVEARTDVLWYPPKSWVWNDDEQWEKVVQSMRKAYKTFVSDYLKFKEKTR